MTYRLEIPILGLDNVIKKRISKQTNLVANNMKLSFSM